MPDEDLCQVCGETLHGDGRHLVLDYFYDLREVSSKFETFTLGYKKSYVLKTCKNCRGDFLAVLKQFCLGKFVDSKRTPNEERVIPIRQNGATVFVTQEEFLQSHQCSENPR